MINGSERSIRGNSHVDVDDIKGNDSVVGHFSTLFRSTLKDRSYTDDGHGNICSSGSGGGSSSSSSSSSTGGVGGGGGAYVFSTANMTFDESDPSVQVPIVIDAAAVSNHQLGRHSKMIYHPLFNGKPGQWPPENYEQYHCMHCGGFCDRGCPVPIVTRYDAKRNKYYVTDIHCSVNCCKGRILEINSFLMNMTTLLTGRMCQEVFKVDFAVMPAPPRLRLRIFGGDLTLEQFRHNFHTIQCTQERIPFIMTEKVAFEELDTVAQQAYAVNETDCCLPFIVDGPTDTCQTDFEMGLETTPSFKQHRKNTNTTTTTTTTTTKTTTTTTTTTTTAAAAAKINRDTKEPPGGQYRINATIRTHNVVHTVIADAPMFEQYKKERAEKIAKGEAVDQFVPQKKSKKKIPKTSAGTKQ